VLPVVGPRLGPRQLRVLEIVGLDSELGLTATEVAGEAALTAPNATVALKRLAELGYLVQVGGQRPARWQRA
jgi:DNA-binding IclR family transcriptional regulator